MEKKVFVVSVSEYLNYLIENNIEGADPVNLTDMEFILESDRQGNTHSLEGFVEAYNDEHIAPGDTFIRILPVAPAQYFHKEGEENHYLVRWEIDEWALTPHEAIQKAIAVFPHENNTNTTATVFDVQLFNEIGQVVETVQIDLMEDEHDKDTEPFDLY